MSRSSSSRASRAGLIVLVAVASASGCAAMSKLFGKKEPAEEPEPVAARPPDLNAPPQSEFSEEEWAEHTAAARAKLKEGARGLKELRLVGDYPKASPQEVSVKGGHCYDVGLAWIHGDHATLVDVVFKTNAEGQRTSETQSMASATLGPSDVMQFCADGDGPVEIAATLLGRDGAINYPPDRKDPVQWAAVLGERPEDPAEREARRKAERADSKAIKAQGRKNLYDHEKSKYGKKVADFCERCRVMAEMCLKERKDQGHEAAWQYCSLNWENCQAPMGKVNGSRVCSPP